MLSYVTTTLSDLFSAELEEREMCNQSLLECFAEFKLFAIYFSLENYRVQSFVLRCDAIKCNYGNISLKFIDLVLVRRILVY